MSKKPRERSEADIYHVMNRGVGHCIIFEDDADRVKFLLQLKDELGCFCAILHAYCLMDNHYHLLVEVPFDDLPKMMRKLDGRYAMYFNAQHGRDGRLFGGPYISEPVKSDEYFLTVLRYIHQNPLKAGMAAGCDCPWSSYREYVGVPRLVSPDLALGLLSGKEGFRRFHMLEDGVCSVLDIGGRGGARGPSDEEALALARKALPHCTIENIVGLPRDSRNEALKALKGIPLAERQIARLTGVPRSTVSRA